MHASLNELLLALAAQPITGSPGLLGALHYGYALRYGKFCEKTVGDQEWRALDDLAAKLDSFQLIDALPSLKSRAWDAGSCSTLHLASKLWDQLPATSQGEFLAGLARHLCEVLRPPELIFTNREKEVANFISNQIAKASLTAQAAAEIACNALRADLPSIFEMVLTHRDFELGASVIRLNSSFVDKKFYDHVAQHATRTADVLLEAAVRCLRPEAVKRLLEIGACPNLPCWNLERSFDEWFNLLTFAIDASKDGEGKTRASQIVKFLQQYGADPLACASSAD